MVLGEVGGVREAMNSAFPDHEQNNCEQLSPITALAPSKLNSSEGTRPCSWKAQEEPELRHKLSFGRLLLVGKSPEPAVASVVSMGLAARGHIAQHLHPVQCSS